MTNPSATMTADHPQLNLWQKTVALVSWGLAGAIFLTIGWFAVEPKDPLGAVSLVMRRDAPFIWLQVLALAAATAAVVTAIAGRLLADVGTFAVALGLGAVSLRGGNAAMLLIRPAQFTRAFERSLALELAVESIVWFVVIAMAIGVSAVVARWFHPATTGRVTHPTETHHVATHALAGYDAPWLGSRLRGFHVGRLTFPADGIKHALIAAAVAVLSISMLSTGLSLRSIRHGQACFIVALALCLGCYVAHRMAPVRSALWSVLAVPLVAIVGFLWAAARPTETGLPPNVPSSHFLRILPIQYIAVGVAAAVMMFWYMYHPLEAESERRPAEREPARLGRRA